jgi:metal-dependent amidase/aminoacylase/carboxypeptidase family protein
VLQFQEELARIRYDIHAHPELGFHETRTSDVVAAKLAEWGCEVHRWGSASSRGWWNVSWSSADGRRPWR